MSYSHYSLLNQQFWNNALMNSGHIILTRWCYIQHCLIISSDTTPTVDGLRSTYCIWVVSKLQYTIWCRIQYVPSQTHIHRSRTTVQLLNTSDQSGITFKPVTRWVLNIKDNVVYENRIFCSKANNNDITHYRDEVVIAISLCSASFQLWPFIYFQTW